MSWDEVPRLSNGTQLRFSISDPQIPLQKLLEVGVEVY